MKTNTELIESSCLNAVVLRGRVQFVDDLLRIKKMPLQADTLIACRTEEAV